MYTRRDLVSATVGFCIYALLREAGAVPIDRSVSAVRWIARQNELARGLAAGTISQVQWHDAVNALAREVDLEDLALELRRAKTRSAGDPFGHDPRKRFVTFLDENGAAVRRSYGVALFSFDSSSAITPHAHRHMASAHMVLDGKLRVRTFDRIRDEDGFLIIRSTADELAEPGYAAAMTTAKNNVHWFTPRTKQAMTLDVIIDGLDKASERYVIEPVDPLGGLQLADGTIRAPLVSFERSMELYPASV